MTGIAEFEIFVVADMAVGWPLAPRIQLLSAFRAGVEVRSELAPARVAVLAYMRTVQLAWKLDE